MKNRLIIVLTAGRWRFRCPLCFRPALPRGNTIRSTTPTITNIPTSPVFGGSFTSSVSTNSDGVTSVTSSTTSVCTVEGQPHG